MPRFMSLTAHRPWLVALITLVVLIATTFTHNLLALLPAYRQLHRTAPFYYVEDIDRIVSIALCVLAVWLSRRAGSRDVIRELGLSAPILPAFAFALGVSLPMLIGLALTRSLTPHLQLLPILFLTVLSPFVEELESRGFGVRQFQRGTSWPFWVVVWPSVIVRRWPPEDCFEWYRCPVRARSAPRPRHCLNTPLTFDLNTFIQTANVRLCRGLGVGATLGRRLGCWVTESKTTNKTSSSAMCAK